MYFQFLIEDQSTEILISHVMEKLEQKYADKDIYYDTKSFHGIGDLKPMGSPLEQKTGKLLNDLPLYLRAFDKTLRNMSDSAIIIVLDNDKRNPEEFERQLHRITSENMILSDHVFCVAVKEMEAWLLGDMDAIEESYPNVRKNAGRNYIQDGICDTWEVLANMIYPGGLSALKRKSANSYHEIGKMKAEWADKIGSALNLDNNNSPSFQFFIHELTRRIETAESI